MRCWTSNFISPSSSLISYNYWCWYRILCALDAVCQCPLLWMPDNNKIWILLQGGHKLPEAVRAFLCWCELYSIVINNVLSPFHQHSDSNNSDPFMDAGLLSSHNDALINNVTFIIDKFPLLFFSLLLYCSKCSVIFYTKRDIIKTEECYALIFFIWFIYNESFIQLIFWKDFGNVSFMW